MLLFCLSFHVHNTIISLRFVVPLSTTIEQFRNTHHENTCHSGNYQVPNQIRSYVVRVRSVSPSANHFRAPVLTSENNGAGHGGAGGGGVRGECQMSVICVSKRIIHTGEMNTPGVYIILVQVRAYRTRTLSRKTRTMIIMAMLTTNPTIQELHLRTDTGHRL